MGCAIVTSTQAFYYLQSDLMHQSLILKGCINFGEYEGIKIHLLAPKKVPKKAPKSSPRRVEMAHSFSCLFFFSSCYVTGRLVVPNFKRLLEEVCIFENLKMQSRCKSCNNCWSTIESVPGVPKVTQYFQKWPIAAGDLPLLPRGQVSRRHLPRRAIRNTQCESELLALSCKNIFFWTVMQRSTSKQLVCCRYLAKRSGASERRRGPAEFAMLVSNWVHTPYIWIFFFSLLFDKALF